jgi:hypothetical protein
MSVGGGTLFRPDLLVKLNSNRIIIIEIDEFQHRHLTGRSERMRMNAISDFFSDCEVIFIRFNPDGFHRDNAYCPSCWGRTNKLLRRHQHWEMRLSELSSEIFYWLHNSSGDKLMVVRLYYDEQVRLEKREMFRQRLCDLKRIHERLSLSLVRPHCSYT